MFERFTERAHKAVVPAQEEARSFGHAYIGTEHFLLGLVREREGATNQMLFNLGVEADQVREQVIWLLSDERSRSGSRAAPRWEVGPVTLCAIRSCFGACGIAPDRGALRGTTALAARGPRLRYAVQDTEGAPRVVNHADLLTSVVGVLEAQELGSVETGVGRVVEHVLERFLAVREVTVSATDQRMLKARAVAGFQVIHTFCR